MPSSKVHYETINSKRALNRVSGTMFRWSLNPYRGCVHGCHYCFARRFHSHFDLNSGEDFTSIIFVKTNAPTLLREELSARSWRRETVALGTATDPYQPIEGKYRLTRGCLEAFADWRSPVGLITKGTMIVRDVDVLSDLSRRTDSSVCISIPTVDAELAKKLEPGTPPPAQRMRALKILVDAGVKAGVGVAPIIPGITDDPTGLQRVVSQAVDHGARFLWGGALHLKGGTKDHFMSFVDEQYPGMKHDFLRMYPGAYAHRTVTREIDDRVKALREDHGFAEMHRREQAARPRQMELSL